VSAIPFSPVFPTVWLNGFSFTQYNDLSGFKLQLNGSEKSLLLKLVQELLQSVHDCCFRKVLVQVSLRELAGSPSP
jgi:hypothetical protein